MFCKALSLLRSEKRSIFKFGGMVCRPADPWCRLWLVTGGIQTSLFLAGVLEGLAAEELHS